jgi:membrane protease YdiL (CAAX protease family)
MDPTPPTESPEPDDILDALPAEPLSAPAVSEEAPLVYPVEPPLPRPVRPGPNIFMALVWWLLVLVAQFVITIGAVVVLVIVAMVTKGPREFQESMKNSGPNAFFDLPGAITVLFVTGGSAILFVAGAIVAILFRAQVRRKIALRGFSVVQLAIIVLMVPPTMLVGGEIQTLAGKILPHFGSNAELYEKLSQQSWLAILVAGCLLPAMGEELFFRGFLSRGLLAQHGWLCGTLFTASLFGLMHLDPPQVVGVTVLAFGFQVAFLSTKSLVAPMVYHALNNGLAFTLLRFGNDERVKSLGGDDTTSLPPMLFATALMAFLALGWLLWETRTRWVLPDGHTWSPGYITGEMPPAHLGAVPRLTWPRTWAVVAAILAYGVFVGTLAWAI